MPDTHDTPQGAEPQVSEKARELIGILLDILKASSDYDQATLTRLATPEQMRQIAIRMIEGVRLCSAWEDALADLERYIADLESRAAVARIVASLDAMLVERKAKAFDRLSALFLADSSLIIGYTIDDHVRIHYAAGQWSIGDSLLTAIESIAQEDGNDG